MAPRYGKNVPCDDLPSDLQRPLDESMPPATLRPAVPPDPGRTAGTGPVPAARRPAEEPPGRTAADPPPEASPPAADPHPHVDSHTPAGAWARLVRVATAPVGVAGSAVRALVSWSGRPAGRLIVPGALIAVLVGVSGVGGTVLVPAVGAAGPVTPSPSAPATTPPPPPPPTAPPVVAQSDPPQGPETGARAEALRAWAAPMSERTGIPVIALQAYGYAELVLARTNPGCHLSWTTLAAIGRVESNHGSAGGARLLPDGRALPAIIGAPLDGAPGRELIPDTDGGALDGDAEYDRAVGPMQFIPQTWRREAVDADGDGVADIHNLNDAALAAANYLCRHGGDLSTPEGWWRAVLAYNNVQAYAEAVFAAADDYGRRSRA